MQLKHALACFVLLLCISSCCSKAMPETLGENTCFPYDTSEGQRNSLSDIKEEEIDKKEVNTDSDSDRDYILNINEYDSVPAHTVPSYAESDRIEMSKAELLEFYGVSFDISEVFADMTEVNAEDYSIYLSESGFQYKGHVFRWESGSDGRYVDILLEKGGNTWSFTSLLDAPAYTEINGVNVLVVHNIRPSKTEVTQDIYVVEIVLADVGYTLSFSNIEDIVPVIEYLIAKVQ